MRLQQSAIKKIQNYFRDKPVLKAYLFGSFGREEADNESDVDILVELDYSKRIGLKFFSMQQDLQNLLNLKVDLVSSEALSPLIKARVEQDKKLVYER